MLLPHLILLSGVQGVTEFLPISSSGHLVFLSSIFNIEERNLLFDVAVHVGTLGAILLYLWRDMLNMISGFFLFLIGRPSFGGRLLLMLVLGTIPIIVIGFIFNHFIPHGITNLRVIAWMTLIFGIILVIVDKIGMTVRRIEHLKFVDVFLIGLFQVLALIPGTSRSGVCISLGRVLGMERRAAARFSLLLGVPAIIGAGSLKAYELWETGGVSLTQDISYAICFSFFFALVSIWGMMAWLRRATLTPFAIYRVILGITLLFFFQG